MFFHIPRIYLSWAYEWAALDKLSIKIDKNILAIQSLFNKIMGKKLIIKCRGEQNFD